MNILQVIPYFSFTRGGDVNVCYNISKQFARMGHTVTILTTTFDYNKEDTDSIDNLSMIPIEYKFNLALFIYSPNIKKWLKEHINDYDIIHLHELRSYQNNVVIKEALKNDIPYILQPHASTPKNISKSAIKHAYDIIYGNKIMENATTTIAVSQEEAYHDKLMKAKDVQVIYNGMNIEDYSKLPPKGLFKNKYSITSPYILYFGRLDKLKGIDFLIKSFVKLPQEYNDFKLVIAGKINDYKKELDKLISKLELNNRIIFTDIIDEKDKISLYHDAQLFVNPVKYMGGVSITVFESILSNTPVIVTPESGELIEKIDAGSIVEYGNVNQLRDKIVESLSNKQLTDRQLHNGQKYIKQNLKWEIVADKILEIYENALK